MLFTYLAAQFVGAGEVEFYRLYPNSPYPNAVYEQASLVRDGPRVRVRIRTYFLRSGLPDIPTRQLVELDCSRRLYRILASDFSDPFGGNEHHSRTPDAPFGPVPRGGGEMTALSDRLCGTLEGIDW